MSHKTPKEPKEARASRNATSDVDANTKSMEALAKSVSAIQASINSFREENRSSIASLQSTLSAFGQRITDVEEGLNDFDRRLTELEQSQISMAKENATLKEKLMYLENYTRRQNIRIVGIPENTEGSQPTEFISNLLFELFRQDFSKPPKVDRAHRIVAQKTEDHDDRPRPFIAKLHHFQVKEKLLRLAREKGTLEYNESTIHLFPDYSAEVNKRRAAFSACKEKLHAAHVRFGIRYPATLRFKHGKEMLKFTVPAEALAYIDKNITKTGHSSSPDVE